jgi:hypothetical protein
MWALLQRIYAAFFPPREVLSFPASPPGKLYSPFEDETTLGAILMRMQALTRAQLVEAIGRKSQRDDLLLGALLREMGFCSETQVASALQIQAQLRRGDSGGASLSLMEVRLSAFGVAEDALTAVISPQKKQLDA